MTTINEVQDALKRAGLDQWAQPDDPLERKRRKPSYTALNPSEPSNSLRGGGRRGSR